MQLIILAENCSNICSNNDRDVEGISKTQVDKTKCSFPFTKEKLDNDISQKYLEPSKSITSSKLSLSINITNNINNTGNAHSKDGNVLPKLPLSQNSPQIQVLTIDLQIYLFRHNG